MCIIVSYLHLGEIVRLQNRKQACLHHSLYHRSAIPAASVKRRSSHFSPSLVRITYRSENDLGTRLGQDGRSPSEQALRRRVDKLTVVVEDHLAKNDLHNSRGIVSSWATYSVSKIFIWNRKDQLGSRLTRPFFRFPRHGKSCQSQSAL